MTKRSRRLLIVAAFLLTAAATQAPSSASSRCVFSGEISYCCWPGHMCQVCDLANCFLAPKSNCPQPCP